VKADAVIDGYDFTGVQLVSASGASNNITFRNCLFDNGSVHLNFAWGNSKNLTVEYCEFRNSNNNEGVINWYPRDGTGTCIIQYCYFNKCPGDGPNAKHGGTVIFRYNVMYNQACGPLAHLDQYTLAEGAITFQPCQFDYNLNLVDKFVFQPGTGTQGFTLQGNSHYAAFLTNGGSISNNVWINTSTSTDNSAGVIYGMWLDCSTTKTGTTWNIKNNYVDDIGIRRMGYANYVWLRVSQVGLGPQHGTVVASGNIDLLDGTAAARLNRTVQG